MPLLETRYLPYKVATAIWKIEEDDHYFLRLLDLTELERMAVMNLRGRRKTEWLASRWCWHTLAKGHNHGPIVKNQHGKPCIKDSLWHMSMSHTHEYTAVITAPLLVGIDIQTKVAKITRLAEKFLNTNELEQVQLSASPIDHLHVYWGAKESLYKAWGRREVDFKKHLSIQSFNPEIGATKGFLDKEGGIEFDIRFEINNTYVFVYAVEKKL